MEEMSTHFFFFSIDIALSIDRATVNLDITVLEVVTALSTLISLSNLQNGNFEGKNSIAQTSIYVLFSKEKEGKNSYKIFS